MARALACFILVVGMGLSFHFIPGRHVGWPGLERPASALAVFPRQQAAPSQSLLQRFLASNRPSAGAITSISFQMDAHASETPARARAAVAAPPPSRIKLAAAIVDYARAETVGGEWRPITTAVSAPPAPVEAVMLNARAVERSGHDDKIASSRERPVPLPVRSLTRATGFVTLQQGLTETAVGVRPPQTVSHSAQQAEPKSEAKADARARNSSRTTRSANYLGGPEQRKSRAERTANRGGSWDSKSFWSSIARN